MTVSDYRKFKDVTVGEITLLEQAYYRLIAEGYTPGFDFKDFLDIVFARKSHMFNEFREMNVLEASDV